MPAERVKTLIIGGGQAGLAMSHRRAELIAFRPLRRSAGIPFLAKIAPEM
jgi:hypothetical protein